MACEMERNEWMRWVNKNKCLVIIRNNRDRERQTDVDENLACWSNKENQCEMKWKEWRGQWRCHQMTVWAGGVSAKDRRYIRLNSGKVRAKS